MVPGFDPSPCKDLNRSLLRLKIGDRKWVKKTAMDDPPKMMKLLIINQDMFSCYYPFRNFTVCDGKPQFLISYT